jgi:hypothetical protein
VLPCSGSKICSIYSPPHCLQFILESRRIHASHWPVMPLPQSLHFANTALSKAPLLAPVSFLFTPQTRRISNPRAANSTLLAVCFLFVACLAHLLPGRWRQHFPPIVPRIRMGGPVPSIPHTSSWCGASLIKRRIKLAFTCTLVNFYRST